MRITHQYRYIMAKVTKAGEGMNFSLATAIYEQLNKQGAGLGNASIHIIEKVLDAEGVQDLPTLEEFMQQCDTQFESGKASYQSGEEWCVYEAGFKDCFNWLKDK